jgi:hypothetical protein
MAGGSARDSWPEIDRAGCLKKLGNPVETRMDIE